MINQHAKVISKTANEILAPCGFRQKGKSRIWVKKYDYWLCVVEFQPSGFSRGTYLNVGACFLWHSKDHISFDIGYREKAFISDQNEFQEAVREYCDHGLNISKELEGKLELEYGKNEILKKEDDHWKYYHLYCCGVMNESEELMDISLKYMLREGATAKWQENLIYAIKEISSKTVQKSIIQRIISISSQKYQ